MSTPAGPRWGRSRLHSLAVAMQGQEHVDALGGLLLRLARYLGGDPVQYLNVASAFGVTAQLPDNVLAESAVLQVTGQPCQYRMDGNPIVAADPVLQVGTVVMLTGRPSIQSFRFQTTSIANSVLIGSYYD